MSGPGGGSGFKGSSTDTPSQTVGDGGFYIKEQAAADADKTEYGQLWVKNNDPNDLYYVNGDGTPVRITNGASVAAAAGAAVAADDINAGDAAVSISTTSGNITLVNSLTASDGLLIPDDTTLRFGTGAGDATIEYDEDGTNQLRFAGADVIFEQAVTLGHTTHAVLNLNAAANDMDSAIQFQQEGAGKWQIKQDGSEDNNFVLRDYGNADVVTIARGSGTGKLVINSTGVGIGFASGSGPGTLLQINGTAPYLTLQNSTAENGAGGCESKIIFEDHGNNALGQIEVSHVGTSDDEIGQMIFKVNNDSGLQTALVIDSNARISLSNNDAGTSNTVFGKLAGAALASGGNYNLLAGENAGNDLTTGDDNTIIGYNTAVVATTTSDLVVIGSGAGVALAAGDTSADGTVLIGKDAGAAITSGEANVAVGYEALKTEDVGDSCVAIGHQALKLQIGVIGEVGNTAVGAMSALAITTGIKNTIVGAHAGKTTTNVDNTVIIGYNAGAADMTSAADGTVLIGKDAGALLTSGLYCTAIGHMALTSVTDGNSCTAVGHGALASSDPDGTTDFGYGGANTGVGANAGAHVSTGRNSTFIGGGAGSGNGAAKTTGHQNTAVGALAGWVLQGAAADNTLVGAKAGDGMTTGAQNTGLGSEVAFDVDANNQIAIGYQATTSVATAIAIGTSITNGTADTVMFGDSANSIKCADWDSSGAIAWTGTSDARKKRNIQDSTLGLEFVNKLRPVTFQWKPQNEVPQEWQHYSETNTWDIDKIHIGFIAQEVKALLDEYDAPNEIAGWMEDPDGMQRLGETKLITPLIKAVQELSAKVAELEAKLDNQQNLIKIWHLRVINTIYL